MKNLPEIGETVIWDGILSVKVTGINQKTGEIEIECDGITRWTWPQYIERLKTKDMQLHEFEGATKLRLHADRLQADNARLLTLLRDLYRAARPTILDDADTGVRLPPMWNERVLKEIQNENQETP